MSVQQYLDWAKARALHHLEAIGPVSALDLLASDFLKHDQLRAHPSPAEGARMLSTGELATRADARRFIESISLLPTR